MIEMCISIKIGGMKARILFVLMYMSELSSILEGLLFLMNTLWPKTPPKTCSFLGQEHQLPKDHTIIGSCMRENFKLELPLAQTTLLS